MPRRRILNGSAHSPSVCSPPPLFFVTDGQRAVVLAFRVPEEQVSRVCCFVALLHAAGRWVGLAQPARGRFPEQEAQHQPALPAHLPTPAALLWLAVCLPAALQVLMLAPGRAGEGAPSPASPPSCRLPCCAGRGVRHTVPPRLLPPPGQAPPAHALHLPLPPIVLPPGRAGGSALRSRVPAAAPVLHPRAAGEPLPPPPFAAAAAASCSCRQLQLLQMLPTAAAAGCAAGFAHRRVWGAAALQLVALRHLPCCAAFAPQLAVHPERQGKGLGERRAGPQQGLVVATAEAGFSICTTAAGWLATAGWLDAAACSTRAPAVRLPAAGSRLLRHLARLADREGLPLYLEASNERK